MQKYDVIIIGAGPGGIFTALELTEKRPDIPELSYIAGRPPVAEFNAWLAERKTP